MGRYLTKLSYRNLIILGLKSKPYRIVVNENSQAIDASKTVWDEANLAYHVNLQTEVKKKVLLDTEYLSFRWTGGFEIARLSALSDNANNNANKNGMNFGGLNNPSFLMMDNNQFDPGFENNDNANVNNMNMNMNMNMNNDNPAAQDQLVF
jgi:hypothetical protein